jgi:hypothetical protein
MELTTTLKDFDVPTYFVEVFFNSGNWVQMAEHVRSTLFVTNFRSQMAWLSLIRYNCPCSQSEKTTNLPWNHGGVVNIEHMMWR